MNNLQMALLQVMNEDAQNCVEAAATEPRHIFSEEFEVRRRQIVRMAECRSVVKRKIRFSRHAVALITAILLLLALTATAVAVMKPQIYYKIRDGLKARQITFEQEGNTQTGEFKYIKPDTPDGFEIVYENKTEASYTVVYDDSEGREIIYSQDRPSGLSRNIDNERGEFSEIEICGQKIMVHKTEDVQTWVFDDGEYVYMISGDTIEGTKLFDRMTKQVLNKN